MGYACPVCEAPQADGEHLANHMAFSAMLHGGAHEAWLDERVPDWADRDPDGLAAEVVECADEVDDETVAGDATGGRPDVDVGSGHAHGPRRDQGGAPSGRRGGSLGDLDAEARRIVEEAVEMTRERRAGDGREQPSEETGQPDGEEERSNGEEERSSGEE